MNISVSPMNSPLKAVKDRVARRRRRSSAAFSENPVDDSESSRELDDIRNHIGELNLNLDGSSRRSRNSITRTNITNQSSLSNHDSFQTLLYSTKGGSTLSPTKDTRAPPKETRQPTTFKMDGVPFAMSLQIEENSRRVAEKKKKQARKKSLADMAELQESLTSLNLQQKKQRPRIKFLNLPKGHPLFWDKKELAAADFPEEDRAFLAKILKNPNPSKPVSASIAVGMDGQNPKTNISRRVELILKKLHCVDWDVATIGRSAMVLFHPDSNPLNLSPVVTKYFYTRFNALKTAVKEGSAIEYCDRLYETEASWVELSARLRSDFEDATQRYEAYQSPFVM
jgi:hypothetical protein